MGRYYHVMDTAGRFLSVEGTDNCIGFHTYDHNFASRFRTFWDATAAMKVHGGYEITCI